MNVYIKILIAIISIIIIAIFGFWGFIQYRLYNVKDTYNLEEKIKKRCQKLIDEKKVVGFSIGIVKDGQIYYTSFGYADLENKIKIDSNSIFEIGSISKVFTTEIAEILHKKYIINWNDNIRNYLPSSGMPKIDDETTLLHLSSHSSGYPGLPEVWFPILKKDTCNPYSKLTMDHLEHYLSHTSQKNKPDFNKSEYSNLGNGLLGHILEWKTGKHYEDLLQEEICNKIGLQNTSLGVKNKNLFVTGYDANRKKTCHWDLPILYSAGAIRSDIIDMSKFLKSNMDGSEFYQSIKETHIPIVKNMEMSVGKGWHIDNIQSKLFNLKPIVWHNGGTSGFSSYIGFIPEEKIGVVILSNQGEVNDEIESLAMQLLLIIKHTSFKK